MSARVQLCTFLKWNLGDSIGKRTEIENGREMVVDVCIFLVVLLVKSVSKSMVTVMYYIKHCVNNSCQKLLIFPSQRYTKYDVDSHRSFMKFDLWEWWGVSVIKIMCQIHTMIVFRFLHSRQKINKNNKNQHICCMFAACKPTPMQRFIHIS